VNPYDERQMPVLLADGAGPMAGSFGIHCRLLHILMNRQKKKESIGGLTNRITELQPRAREF